MNTQLKGVVWIMAIAGSFAVWCWALTIVFQP
jgi:hypothetical protein